MLDTRSRTLARTEHHDGGHCRDKRGAAIQPSSLVQLGRSKLDGASSAPPSRTNKQPSLICLCVNQVGREGCALSHLRETLESLWGRLFGQLELVECEFQHPLGQLSRACANLLGALQLCESLAGAKPQVEPVLSTSTPSTQPGYAPLANPTPQGEDLPELNWRARNAPELTL